MAAPPPPSWRGQQWTSAPPAVSYADITATDAPPGSSADGIGQEPSLAAPPAFRMPQPRGRELYVATSQQQQELLMQMQMQQINQQQQLYQQQQQQPQQQWAAPAETDFEQINQQQQQQQQWNTAAIMDTYTGNQLQTQQEQVQQQQQWGVSTRMDEYAGNLQQDQQVQVQQQQQWDASMRMDVYTQNTQQQQAQTQQQVQTQQQQVQQQQHRRSYEFLESEIRDLASTSSGSESGGTQRSTAVIQPGDAIVPEEYRDQIQIEMPIPPRLGPPSFHLPFAQSRGGGYSYGGYPRSEYANGGGMQNPAMTSSVTFVPFGAFSDEWPVPDPFNGYNNNSSNDNNSAPVENQFGKTTWNREQHFSAAASAINPSFNNANMHQASSSSVFGKSQNLLSVPLQSQPRQNKQSKQLQSHQHSAARAAAETLYALHSPIYSPPRNEVNLGTNGSNPWHQVQSRGVAVNLKKASVELKSNRLSQLLNMTVEQQNYELSLAADTSVGDDFLDVLTGRGQSVGYDSKIVTGDGSKSGLHQRSAPQQTQGHLPQSATGCQLSNGHMEATGVPGAVGVPFHTQQQSTHVASKEMKKKAPAKRKRVKDAAVHERKVQLPMSALMNSDNAVDEWVVPAPEPKKKGASRPQPAPVYRMTSTTANLHAMNLPTVSVPPANAAVKKKAFVKRRKRQDITIQESKPQDPITMPVQKPTSDRVIAPDLSVPMFARIPDLELANGNVAAAMATSNAMRNLMNPVGNASGSGTANGRHDQGLIPPTSNLDNLPILGSQSFFQPGSALQRPWEEKKTEDVAVPPKQPRAKQPKGQRRNAQGAPTEKRSRKRKNEVAASNGVHPIPVGGLNTQMESNALNLKSRAPQPTGRRNIRIVSKQATDAMLAEIDFSYSNHGVVPAVKSGSTSSVSTLSSKNASNSASSASTLPSKNMSNSANALPIIVNNSVEKEVTNGSRSLPGTWTERGFVQAEVQAQTSKHVERNVVDLTGGDVSTLRTPVPIAPKPSTSRANQLKEPAPAAAIGMVGSKTEESAGNPQEQVQATSSEALSQPNNTIMIFCKRDFMRYQAAKLWKKYQEKKKKMEFQSVQVLGKRTRYVNARYEEEQAHAQAQKKAKAPKKTRKSKTVGSSGSAQSNGASVPEQAKKSREDAQNLAATPSEQAERDEVKPTDQTPRNEVQAPDEAQAQTNEMRLSEPTPRNEVVSVEQPPGNEATPVEQVSSTSPGGEAPVVTSLKQPLSNESTPAEHTPGNKTPPPEQDPSNEVVRLDRVASTLPTELSQVNEAASGEEAPSVEMEAAAQAPSVTRVPIFEQTSVDETKPFDQTPSSEGKLMEQRTSNNGVMPAETSTDMTTLAEPASSSEAAPAEHVSSNEAARNMQPPSSEVTPTVEAMPTTQTAAAPRDEVAPNVQASSSEVIPIAESFTLMPAAAAPTDDVTSVELVSSAIPAPDAPRIDEVSFEQDPANELMPAKEAPSCEVTPTEQELSELTPSNEFGFLEETSSKDMLPVEQAVTVMPTTEASTVTVITNAPSSMPTLEALGVMLTAETPSAKPSVELSRAMISEEASTLDTVEQAARDKMPAMEFSRDGMTPSEQQSVELTTSSDAGSVEDAEAPSVTQIVGTLDVMASAKAQSNQMALFEQVPSVLSTGEASSDEVTPFVEVPVVEMKQIVETQGVELTPVEQALSKLPSSSDSESIEETSNNEMMPVKQNSSAEGIIEDPNAISTEEAPVALVILRAPLVMPTVESPSITMVPSAEAPSCEVAPFEQELYELTPRNELESVEQISSTVVTPTLQALIATPTVGAPIVTKAAEVQRLMPTTESSDATRTFEDPCNEVTLTEIVPSDLVVLAAQTSSYEAMLIEQEPYELTPINEFKPCGVTPSNKMVRIAQAPVDASTEETSSNEATIVDQEPFSLAAEQHQVIAATSAEQPPGSEVTAPELRQPISDQTSMDETKPFIQALSDEFGSVEHISSEMTPVVDAFRAMPTAAAPEIVETLLEQAPANDLTPLEQVPSNEVMLAEQASITSSTPSAEAPSENTVPITEAPSYELTPIEQDLSESTSSSDIEFVEVRQTPNNTAVPTQQAQIVTLLATDVPSVTHITETLYVIPSAEAPNNKARLAEQVPKAISIGEAPSDDTKSCVEARGNEMVPGERKRSAFTSTDESKFVEPTSRDEIWPIRQVPTSMAQIANALSNKWTLLGQVPKAISTGQVRSSEMTRVEQKPFELPPSNEMVSSEQVSLATPTMDTPCVTVTPTTDAPCVAELANMAPSVNTPGGMQTVESPSAMPTAAEDPNNEATLLKQVPSAMATVKVQRGVPIAEVPIKMSTVKVMMGAVETPSCEVVPSEQHHSELIPSCESTPVKVHETTSTKQTLVVTPTAEIASNDMAPIEQTASHEVMSTPEAPCATPAEQAPCITITPEGASVVPAEQVPMEISTPQAPSNEVTPTAEAPSVMLPTANEPGDVVTPTEQLSRVVATEKFQETMSSLSSKSHQVATPTEEAQQPNETTSSKQLQSDETNQTPGDTAHFPSSSIVAETRDDKVLGEQQTQPENVSLFCVRQ